MFDLNAMWNETEALLRSKGVPEDMIEMCKLTFYAGAMAAYNKITADLKNYTNKVIGILGAPLEKI